MAPTQELVELLKTVYDAWLGYKRNLERVIQKETSISQEHMTNQSFELDRHLEEARIVFCGLIVLLLAFRDVPGVTVSTNGWTMADYGRLLLFGIGYGLKCSNEERESFPNLRWASSMFVQQVTQGSHGPSFGS